MQSLITGAWKHRMYIDPSFEMEGILEGEMVSSKGYLHGTKFVADGNWKTVPQRGVTL